MTIRKRTLPRLMLAAVATFVGVQAAALAESQYPARPIRIIVPTAPGGPSDISARLIAQELSKRWGRQVVVETRPGAGTIIGSEIVARAPPDGYTLLVSPSTLAINPASYKKMPYDAFARRRSGNALPAIVPRWWRARRKSLPLF